MIERGTVERLQQLPNGTWRFSVRLLSGELVDDSLNSKPHFNPGDVAVRLDRTWYVPDAAQMKELDGERQAHEQSVKDGMRNHLQSFGTNVRFKS